MSLWPSAIASGKKTCSRPCYLQLKASRVLNVEKALKRCAACLEWKPLDAFQNSKGANAGAHGKQAYCAPCSLAKNKRWREANPKRRRDIARRHYWKDPEKSRKLAREFSERTREQKNAAAREYRQLNRDKVLWWNKLRLHRVRAAGPMPNRWHFSSLLCKQDARCAYCRVLFDQVRYQIDHKTPVSRGGNNEPDNLQLVCPTCNMKKGSKTDAEYMALIGERGIAVYADD